MIVIMLGFTFSLPFRFVTMGGLTIMSTWLSLAAIEEQTSVILVIFKVLIFFISKNMYLCVVCKFFDSSFWSGASPPPLT